MTDTHRLRRRILFFKGAYTTWKEDGKSNLVFKSKNFVAGQPAAGPPGAGQPAAGAGQPAAGQPGSRPRGVPVGPTGHPRHPDLPWWGKRIYSRSFVTHRRRRQNEMILARATPRSIDCPIHSIDFIQHDQRTTNEESPERGSP